LNWDLIVSILPALLIITLVIVTRKVLISLGVGIVLAALIINGGNPIEAVVYMVEVFWGIISDYYWYLPILGFVIIIGGITSVITLSGGVKAFADWAVSKVKSAQAAQFMTWILGIIIMIDDYFNALIIGEVSKPITDQYNVSRAKLAYVIDSTSAPVVILMPVSTWGAYIIGILGGLFVTHGYAKTGFAGLVSSVPYQFYPITAIIMVFLVIKFGIKIGPMVDFEASAENGNDTSKVESAIEVAQVEVKGTKANQWTLIAPILLLVFTTFFVWFWMAGFDFSSMMETDITIPLFSGGVVAFILSVILALVDRNIHFNDVAKVSGKGMFAMVKSAAAILVLAWMVSWTIGDLETGVKIADAIGSASITSALIPLVLFIVAGLMAFSTGTSWGSFAVLLPIAVPIAMVVNPEFMPVIIAAVLGGCVFGDHASPVSDTTVLSSTGAQSTLHSHFISQLPYALITAGIASLGYLLYGLTEMLFLSYILIAVLLFLFVKFWPVLFTRKAKAVEVNTEK